jgi:serine/threonine-protein kinase HipA
MPRRRQHAPLCVYQNNLLVGHLRKEASGAIDFQYDDSWLSRRHAFPVSLSLPLREDAYRGAPVIAVFENLLPDSDALRRRVAEKVGATGTDACSLLAAIGADCVGALQFIGSEDDVGDTKAISGEPVDDEAIERILNNLAQAPLGLNRDDDFRISVAGAQEKTALLRYEGQWLKPHGTTPTTHIFKTQIGTLPNGIDLTNSVENEHYCLRLIEAFGLPVNKTEICRFGQTTALVVERFDRQWGTDGRLLRLPQEDCCQALSVPPSQKYESDRGPGISKILELLKGSDDPALDQDTFLKAQILYWLMGATDGHAKNFSIFLLPGGGYRMTPLYDILSAQPSLVAHQIRQNQMKLAMCVGTNRHYRINDIHVRHFVETGSRAGVPKKRLRQMIEEIHANAERAIDGVTNTLPSNFPADIHDAVSSGIRNRLQFMVMSESE